MYAEINPIKSPLEMFFVLSLHNIFAKNVSFNEKAIGKRNSISTNSTNEIIAIENNVLSFLSLKIVKSQMTPMFGFAQLTSKSVVPIYLRVRIAKYA